MRPRGAVLLVALLLAACGGGGSAPPVSPSETIAVLPSFGGTSVAPSPAPAISGLTGHLVFTRAGGAFGDETVFASGIDGSDEIQLSNPDSGCCPWALRDGSLVVRGGSSADGRLDPIFSRLDGSEPRLLPLPKGLEFGGGPLSPDGRRIVLEGFNDPGQAPGHTYVADVDGRHVAVLTDQHFIPGDFSPDGRRVVLFRTAMDSGGEPQPGSLWVVDVDGSHLRQLTPDGTEVQCCFNYRWSPDGSRILFASPDGGLWTIRPDGTGLMQVFRSERHWAITPTWSPDGSMILFGLDRSADPFKHPPNALYVIRSDGTGLTLVLDGSDFKREPVWVSG